jgi:3-carboxy-cis,cis-muconate cycloisomerase
MQDASLFVPLFATAAMREVFSDTARLQAMLDFESALAGAQAACGTIPVTAAPAIARACDAARFDLRALAQATALAGNAAIPLVRALRNAVAAQDEQAARHVHQGATSQDCIDSGLVLQLQRAYALLDVDVGRLGDTLCDLAVAQAATVMPGRTLLQQAEPVSFGLKIAGWLDALSRSRHRLRAAAHAVNVIQCGGATGSLAAFGARGLEVAAALAQTLGAALPTLPWHSQRDRLVDLGGALAILIGSLGKMARDVALLAQTEVGEVAEPLAPGRGGSSVLPHKQNPIGCAVALAAAAQAPGLQATLLGAMTQEHERGLGGWHAEWETLPRLCLLASGALAQMNEVLAGLRVNPARMRENLAADGGLMFAPALAQALAVHWGAGAAHDRVTEWCRIAQREGCQLREIAGRVEEVTRVLDAATLDAVFDPEAQLGLAAALIARAADAWRAAQPA